MVFPPCPSQSDGEVKVDGSSLKYATHTSEIRKVIQWRVELENTSSDVTGGAPTLAKH